MYNSSIFNKRLYWVDFLKGIVILLVVLGHINRGFIGGNMFTNLPLQYIDFTIYSFHMPLMFMLAGVVYANKFNFNNYYKYKDFIKIKFISLYIPYLVFSCIMFFFKFISAKLVNNPVNLNNIFTIPIIPYDIYWFLICLLIIFIFYGICDLKINNSNIILMIARR